MALTFKGTPKGVHHDVVASVRTFARTVLKIEDVRLGRLDPAEQHELVELVERGETRPEGGLGFDWKRLGKRRVRFEELLARAAGLRPDYFAQQRKDAETFREIRELGAEARRAVALRREQEGDFFRAIYAKLENGHLLLAHAALLLSVIAQLQAGKTLAYGATIEGDELVIDATWGLLGRADPDGDFGSWEWLLGGLASTAGSTS
jgi:hypothetical protein